MSVENILMFGTIVIVLLFVAYIKGCMHEEARLEKKAIKAGVAEYYLDKNHERRFRFKEGK